VEGDQRVNFARATQLTSIADGRFGAQLQPGWDAFGGITNGGYLLALAANAAMTVTDREDPISVTAHYLGPGRSGTDVEISTRILKKGRLFGTASVDLTTDGAPTISVLATCGSAPNVGVDIGLPDLPPPSDCRLVEPGDPLPPPMVGRVETRIHPDDDFVAGGPTGIARLRGWFRLLDGEPLSSLAVVLATDTWPPPLFAARGPMGWIATVELTVQIRSRPQGEWLACVFDNNIVSGGIVSWDGTITDETGRLVATCRQLALMPRG
jgi:acyl-CoA thioesterase